MVQIEAPSTPAECLEGAVPGPKKNQNQIPVLFPVECKSGYASCLLYILTFSSAIKISVRFNELWNMSKG